VGQNRSEARGGQRRPDLQHGLAIGGVSARRVDRQSGATTNGQVYGTNNIIGLEVLEGQVTIDVNIDIDARDAVDDVDADGARVRFVGLVVGQSRATESQKHGQSEGDRRYYFLCGPPYGMRVAMWV
jgi:hypothetical protein